MKNLRLFVALAVLCPTGVFAQAIGTVTSPATSSNIRGTEDFATRAFQDPWDMNQKTDVGPFLGSNDVGSNGWAPGFTFTGGLFTGTTASDAQLWLLDTGNPNAAPIGKTGTNFPIDANNYKVFAFRMTRPPGAGLTQAQVLTWPNTIYDSGLTTHTGGAIFGGTGVYFLNLGAAAGWSGLQRALRFDPTTAAGETVSVDWARLVPAGDANSCQPIRWTGGLGPDQIADVYLDTDNNFSNGFYGVVQTFATTSLTSVSTSATRNSPGCPVLSGAYNFHVGALPAGTYFPFVVPFGEAPSAANAKYSAGSWTVNGMPTLQFTAPTAEGSTDDFASSQLGDAWDFNSLSDIDTLFNVDNPTITTLNMEKPDGTALPAQQVFLGTSTAAAGGCAAVGDPVMVMLDFAKRGRNVLIDTNRYRLLTVEFGIPNAPRDVNCGSIARIVWHKKGDSVTSGYSVSDDILFNHRAGVNLLDKFTVDLKTLFVEQGTGAGGFDWNNGAQGGVDYFRFDPHEFGPATQFYVKRIKIADYERAKNSYTITWTFSDPAGSVDLFYDMDGSGFDGTMFAQGLNATAGSFPWTLPSNLPIAGGTPVYIYAVFRNVNAVTCLPSSTTCSENRVYAPLPIMADSSYTQKARLVISRRTLNFGVLANTATTSAPQTTRLTFTGAAEVTPCWTITNTNQNFVVSPSSGTGNATLTVSMAPQTFPGGGTGTATFTVNECQSGVSTMLNPGQTFTANFRITTGSTPVGSVDTPADGLTNVTGSIGVTGWVIDDIDVTAVRVYRNAVSGETGDALGRIFLGTASRVDDARPDIEAANPTTPFNYRAGWGYLLLTNFLPNLGNGTFTLSVYAADAEGRETFIGQKTITVSNSTATAPFGAIDTPGQGETVSGTLNNFGWVLARAPFFAAPPDGGTVTVLIDGTAVGSPTGWVSRPDLTALFPASEYPGVSRALGVFTFNTAAYQDGVHTISWIVFANNGQGDGIGSRYFTTVNGNSLTLANAAPNVLTPNAAPASFVNLGRQARDVARLDEASDVRATIGYSKRPRARAVAADATGLRTVYSRSHQRVVVDASARGVHRYEAYLVAGGTLTPLPVGASFDDQRGVLYWQPAVGYTGSYDFMVIRDGQARIPVRVVLGGDVPGARADRLFRGLFATGVTP